MGIPAEDLFVGDAQADFGQEGVEVRGEGRRHRSRERGYLVGVRGQDEGIRWFVESTPIQTPPEPGGICGRLTQDLPQGGQHTHFGQRRVVLRSHLTQCIN